MLQAPIELSSSPHVIVVGNEKGGSGKTTVAMHIAIALMKAGQRVATIDLDSRQKSLTHYLENRRAWAKRTHTDLELAVHFSVARAEGAKVHENEAAEFADFDKVITAAQHCHFLVIDTPPHDGYLMRLAHSIADTLVSPLNDSFLDLDVLAMVDPVTFAVTEVSHYAEMVRKARRLRQSVVGRRVQLGREDHIRSASLRLLLESFFDGRLDERLYCAILSAFRSFSGSPARPRHQRIARRTPRRPD